MKFYILGLIILSFSTTVFAFPDMIRHGYTNCTACHVSTSGGGLLNPYGRSLSKELLSTWSGEKEAGLLHFIDTEKIDEWLALGGDFRSVQVHQENDSIKRGRWITMQAGVEIGIVQPTWSVVSFIGEQKVQENKWSPNSTRYYGMYTPIDGLYFKVGRFLPNFGINLPDHILSTRGPLQFGYGMERNTAEVTWLGENWNFNVSGYKTPENLSAANQTGQTLTATYTMDNFKTGLQFLSEKDDLQTRTIAGAIGYLGWSKDFGTLIEIDQSVTRPSAGTDRTGTYLMHRSSYEVFKGFSAVILNDYFQSDIKNGATKNYKYGPGIQWLPRPHFDIQAFWTREQTSTSKEGNYAWLVLHYYL
jgi:hypothetical protein